jgi:hypothetical protein
VISLLTFLGLVGGYLTISNSYATGVFNIPRFVNPGAFAVGLEPELDFTGGTNLGLNLRFNYGIADSNNLHAMIGTGAGSRQFRIGAAYTFDFFPDIEKQPGIGVAVQGLFVQLPSAGSFEITAIPYIHKTFNWQGESAALNFEPFFATPVGLALASGNYQTLVTLAFGSMFHHNEHFSSVVELGVSVSNAYTYFSGGIVYYR